jgi:hypothetical protein
MIRQYSLRLTAFLLLTTFASSASACCLLPFLNPFAWTCGYGYGHGYGRVGCGSSQWNPQCGYVAGYGYRGYQSYGSSSYAPSYSAGFGASASDCNCGGSHGSAVVPQGAVPGAAWNTQPMAWSAQTAWLPQQHGMNFQPVRQQTVMSTAPIYGPTWESSAPPTDYRPQVAGDIRGDHEYPVIQNTYRGGARPPIHRTSFQRFPRATPRYSRSVR